MKKFSNKALQQRSLKYFKVLIFMTFLSSTHSTASQNTWTKAYTNGSTTIKASPDTEAKEVGKLPGKVEIQISESPINGFYAVYFKRLWNGIHVGWISESVLEVPKAGADSTTVETPHFSSYKSVTLSLQVGVPTQFNYQVQPKATGIATTNLNTNGISFQGKLTYSKGPLNTTPGFEFSAFGNFGIASTINQVQLSNFWEVGAEVAYKNLVQFGSEKISAFSPLITLSTENLPLPYPYQTVSATTSSYESLANNLQWVGIGFRLNTILLQCPTDLTVEGAYSLNSTSTLSTSGFSYQNYGFKATGLLNFQITHLLIVGFQVSLLSLSGDQTITGNSEKLLIGIQL